MKYFALLPLTSLFAQDIDLQIIGTSIEKGKCEVYAKVENTGLYGLYMAQPDDVDYGKNFSFELVTAEGRIEKIQKKERSTPSHYRLKRLHLAPGEFRIFKFELLDGNWNFPSNADSPSILKMIRINYRQEMNLDWASQECGLSISGTLDPFISHSYVGESSSQWYSDVHHDYSRDLNPNNEEEAFYIYGLKLSAADVLELKRLLGNKLYEKTQPGSLSVSERNYEVIYHALDSKKWRGCEVCMSFTLDDERKTVIWETSDTLSPEDNALLYNMFTKYRDFAKDITMKCYKQSSDCLKEYDDGRESKNPLDEEKMQKIKIMLDELWDEPLPI